VPAKFSVSKLGTDFKQCNLEQPGVVPGAIIGCVIGRRRSIEMPLLTVVLYLIVVGVLLWLVNAFIPMASSIKSILNAVVVIAVVLWLLNAFGLIASIQHLRIGRG
jgi:hypothetical protein